MERFRRLSVSEGEMRQRSRVRLVAGRYLLLNELGRGGMGTVWLADDQLIARRVAVKELRPPQGLPAEREVFARRALSEANSAARIHHPGAVTLFDAIPATASDDAVYLIMELIEGPTVAQLIQAQGRLPDATVAGYGLQLLDVLEAAHALGITHRDVKPANIMITAGGQVKLTDFGIAHIAGDARLTRSGVMGTQAYMAPELFESQPITPAADLWALGATLYAAASGYGPFDRDSTAATLRAILIDDVPAPRCSPALATAITSLLQRDPARRATTDQARPALSQAATQASTSALPAPMGWPATPTGPRPADGTTGAMAAGQPPPTPPTPWEQAKTTRAPSSPPFPLPPPTAATNHVSRRRLLGPAGPQRMHRVIAAATVAIVVIAACVAGAVLLQPGGSSLQSGGSSAGPAPIATLDGSGAETIDAISFSSNDRELLTSAETPGAQFSGAQGYGAWLWNATTGAAISTAVPAQDVQSNASPPASQVSGMAFSPDNGTLAVADEANDVSLWNIATRAWDSPMAHVANGFQEAVAFSPDGKTLATGDEEGDITLWNVASRKAITSWRDPNSGAAVTAIAFSPDGNSLATGDGNGFAYLWNVAHD
jgi:serine/threonine protein kinase